MYTRWHIKVFRTDADKYIKEGVMKEPLVNITQRLHSITLQEGEFLTVYVPSQEDPASKIQIEVRVTKSKGAEIFCDNLPVKTFDAWTRAEE